MRRIVSVLLFAMSLAWGCAEASSGNEVAMVPGRRFEPETLTVPPGTTVRWPNEGDDAHTVTAYQESVADGARYFSSGGFETEDEARDEVAKGLVPPGGSYEFTFEEPGTYDYFCIPHEAEGMKGTIVVEE